MSKARDCPADAGIYSADDGLLRGWPEFDGLREFWGDVAPMVKTAHPGMTFAESVLDLPEGSWREVSALAARLRCPEHN